MSKKENQSKSMTVSLDVETVAILNKIADERGISFDDAVDFVVAKVIPPAGKKMRK